MLNTVEITRMSFGTHFGVRGVSENKRSKIQVIENINVIDQHKIPLRSSNSR